LIPDKRIAPRPVILSLIISLIIGYPAPFIAGDVWEWTPARSAGQNPPLTSLGVCLRGCRLAHEGTARRVADLARLLNGAA
jgi:hypothetical protein